MYVKVRVTPKSAKEKIEKKSDNYYLISVKEPAERNLANNRVCRILASIFKVAENKIRLINGHKNTSKIFSINSPTGG